MRIETLEIKNYRQYRDAKFTFAQPVLPNDIHIILGKNGTGKSNMLNAITWCLYGDELHLGDKNVSIDKLNTESIMAARGLGIEKVILKVSMTIKTDDTFHPKMHIERSVPYYISQNHAQAQEENLVVQELDNKNNWYTYSVPEDKISTISRHIPQQINEYIFFDGEQLEKYFQGANRQKLQGGINNLTQITLIDQAIEAFGRYDRNELSPKIKNSGDATVKDLHEKISQSEEALQSLEKDLEEVKRQKGQIIEDIEGYNKLISNNEKLGEKKNQYSKLESKLREFNIRKNDKLHELMIFVREQYILFGLYSSLMRFYKYIKSEADKGNLPPHFDKNILQEILTQHTCAVCGQPVEGDAYKHIKEIIDRINVSSKTAAILNQSLVFLRMRFDEMKAYPSKLKEKQDAIKHLDQEISACENEISSLKRYLNSIPGQEVILKAISDKEEAVSARTNCDQKIGRISENIDRINKDLSDYRKKLQDAMGKIAAMEELSKQKEYLDKCRDILRNVKSEIMAETKERMERETFEIFQTLIWKKDAFSRVEIDDDYTFKLYDRYHNQTLGSCSAAERALLALSFTLALQNVSGHSSLLYIDTPIGRVDSENRENFMKNLLEVSKEKQVILTFTPTEYDMTVSEILNNRTATFVKLKSENGVTSVEKQ